MNAINTDSTEISQQDQNIAKHLIAEPGTIDVNDIPLGERTLAVLKHHMKPSNEDRRIAVKKLARIDVVISGRWTNEEVVELAAMI